ncbi:MAG TPA: GspH/FimT family pseudopilin [Verrucomicrobiae bacterium]|jgi:Tfp pilus assembly protein FimT
MKIEMPIEGCRPARNYVAQVSKPAVSPTSKSAGLKQSESWADLEIRDTADLEVCATAAFTLIELMLVLALIVVAVSIVIPRMENFIHGRALDLEGRRLEALMHAGQARAVSEGMPMVLWFDQKSGEYGLETETPPKGGDVNAEELPMNEYVQVSMQNVTGSGTTTYKSLPAIRFLPDGTIDDNSPQTLQLTEDNNGLLFTELQNHTGYEVGDNTKQ